MGEREVRWTPPSTVYSGFVEVARQVSGDVAQDDVNGLHSFEELYARSEVIRCHLQTHGIEPGDLVGLLLDRDLDLPASIMAVFGAGAAYLPLDKGDPAERHMRALALCPCRCVLGPRATILPLRYAFVEKGVRPIPDFIAFEDILPTAGTGPAPRPSGPDDIAYVLLTSGSTGTPKAVNVTHGNVITLLTSAQERLTFTAEDRYLATSPLTFDASIPELFLPLVTGARIVLHERDLVLRPGEMAEVVRSSAVTIAQTTPSTWQAVLTAEPDFPPVRILITHGEAVSPAFARSLAPRAEMVLNMYGPTETTVWATAHTLTEDLPDGRSASSAPIGTPLGHFEIAIVDAEGRTLPAGEAGELLLGGPSVTRGYRNDQERTARVFTHRDGTAFYHTGDLVVQNDDGVIDYLGRIDDQMAINGLRIEPGEIEAALMAHPDVARAAVTWYPVTDDQRSIVAAVVPQAGTPLAAETLRKWLADRLSRAMLPARYQILGALPTLTSGKIDRKSIRAAALEAGGDAVNLSVSDLTETEEVVARIWRKLLKVSHVSAEDNFFLIGGDSLAAVEMITLLEAERGESISIEMILETPKLSEFAALLDAGADATASEDSTVIQVKSARHGTPLFFALADYGYVGRAGQKIPCPFYNLTVWNRTDGIVNMDRLEDLAARYKEEISAAQPSGPYRLAGYSFGGLLVFELARQLIADGHRIASLFLIDATAPTMLELRPGTVVDGMGRTDVTRGFGPAYLVEEAKRHARRAPLDLKSLSWKRRYTQVNRALQAGGGSDIDRTTRHRAMVYALGRLSSRYVAKPLDVPATIIGCDPKMTQVWQHLMPQARIERLDIGHRDVFKAPVDETWTRVLLDVLENDGADPALVAAAE
ncbi:MAG: amino acid adenylation domain-containing protein [Pseudomonadota bacterium]